MGKHIDDYHLVSHTFGLSRYEQLTMELKTQRNIQVLPEDITLASLLNRQQKFAYDLIFQAALSSTTQTFFIDGPGGTGKTFLYRALLATLRSQGYVATAVATSGVAASILPGGRTAHSRFKIPLDFSIKKTCQLSKQSSVARLIVESKLILWDEASMAKKEAIEAFDYLLKDIMDCDLPFGGKVVVFGRDFRQTLPVIEKASREMLIQSSLANSPLWTKLRKISLTENMRALLDPAYTNFLLRIGEGREPQDKEGQIVLPNDIAIPYYNKEEFLNRMSSIQPIKDIMSGIKTWTSMVTVQEKQQVTSSMTTPTTKQKFIFVDSEGSQVEGIIFNSDITTMSPRIQVYKRYLISNADVREIPQQYRTLGLAVQWVITTKTIIEEVPDSDEIIPVKFSYSAFKDLALCVDQKNKSVDILAIAVHALEKKPVNKNNRNAMVQNFVIVNEKFQCVMLSLWDDFIINEGQKIIDNLHNFPILICRRLRVGYFNGVTLSSWFDSAILVDPPVQEARELKNWAMRNASSLSDIVHQQSYNNFNPEISYQSEQKTVLLANVLPTQKSVWVKVMFSFEHIRQKYWYMACKKCYHSTSASHGIIFLCNTCSQKHPAEPRCRFDIDLIDESGMITASIFGELAEKLLTFSALEAMEHYNKNEELPIQKVNKYLKSKTFLAHIKPVQPQLPDGKQRYTIICYYEASELQNEHQNVSSLADHREQTIEHDNPESSSSRIGVSLTEKFNQLDIMERASSVSLEQKIKKKRKLA